MVFRVYGYNTHMYTLQNHSTADLYYDATTQTTNTVLYYAARVYEISRVHGFCTSCFSFEVWLHHRINKVTLPVLFFRFVKAAVNLV